MFNTSYEKLYRNEQIIDSNAFKCTNPVQIRERSHRTEGQQTKLPDLANQEPPESTMQRVGEAGPDSGGKGWNGENAPEMNM